MNNTVIHNSRDGLLRFDSSNNLLQVYYNNQWNSLSLTYQFPTLTSVSTNVLPNANSQTTVTGTNFESGLLWTIIGRDASTFLPNVTLNNPTSVTLTLTSALISNITPYRIKVYSPKLGYDYISPNDELQLQINTGPSFSTASNLGNINTQGALTPISMNASHTSPIISMKITSGRLPPGLSGVFTSNANTGTYTISGTLTLTYNTTTTITFTVSAYDASLNIGYRSFTFDLIP
jgi:hypothetical protein